MIPRLILVAFASAALGVAGSQFATSLGQGEAPSPAAAAIVTPAIAQELGLSYNARGVVVRQVAGGSPADRMGLRAGDIILNPNGRDILSAGDFRSVADARPEAWQIVLQRDGRIFRSFVSG